MKRRIKNTSVEALICKISAEGRLVVRQSGELSLAEWQTAFQQFKQFPYPTSRERLFDLEIVVTTGFVTLGSHQDWETLNNLADWVLNDPGFVHTSYCLSCVYYYKALGLVRREQVSIGLDYYLQQISQLVVSHPRQRRSIYGLGIDLLLASKPAANSKGEAPYQIVMFARELFFVCYPNRKATVPIRKENSKLSYTWEELHRALLKSLRSAKINNREAD